VLTLPRCVNATQVCVNATQVESRAAAAGGAGGSSRTLDSYRWEDVGARVLVTVPLLGATSHPQPPEEEGRDSYRWEDVGARVLVTVPLLGATSHQQPPEEEGRD
jgi:hypothetical protein